VLNLRIVRGPLTPAESGVILREYNRLTHSRIPIDEYLNWVERSPAGPAWHALLETDEGRVVGHTSLFPFPTQYDARPLIPAKSEYSFMLEDFRKEKIAGYEKAARATFVVMLDELFQRGQKENWGPIFASTNDKNQAFTRRIGLQPAEYAVWECLYVMRPINASRHTPNLSEKQRLALIAAGTSHRALWMATQIVAFGRNGVHSTEVSTPIAEPEVNRLAFFEDAPSMKWRYLDGQYVRLAASNESTSYVIAKKGSNDRYLRVCQWKMEDQKSIRAFAFALLKEARREGAMGVRWAVYEDNEEGRAILRQLKRMGFLSAQRQRIVMVHKKDPEFLPATAWKMNDSLFSFDP
jgi:hypothetical protein